MAWFRRLFNLFAPRTVRHRQLELPLWTRRRRWRRHAGCLRRSGSESITRSGGSRRLRRRRRSPGDTGNAGTRKSLPNLSPARSPPPASNAGARNSTRGDRRETPSGARIGIPNLPSGIEVVENVCGFPGVVQRLLDKARHSSGKILRSTSITSPDVSTHLRPS
jgi:hypothetical protein